MTSLTDGNVSRSRRRGRKVIKGQNEKENRPLVTTTKSSPLRKEFQGATQESPWAGSIPQQYLQDALKTFQRAQASTASSKFWEENNGLAESVVRVSLSKSGDVFGMFHLQERAGALVNNCRSLLREIAEKKTCDLRMKCNNLVVAAHGLRAASSTTTSEISRQEAIMKLLFHLITVASECFTKDKDEVLFGVICLAGYEALGRLMLKYECLRDKKSPIGFRWEQGDEDGFPTKLFCVPVKIDKVKQPGSMTLRQVSTIGLKATFAVAEVARKLYQSCSKHSIRQSSSKSFGPVIHNMVQHSFDNDIHPYRMLVVLIQRVAVPWISFLFDSEEVEYSRDALVQCKAAHRILWEAASQLPENENAYPKEEIPRLSLDLRAKAISVLISREYENLQLRNKLLEMASSVSWKAAATYIQQTGLTHLPTQSERHLLEFHQAVGSRLHEMVSTDVLPLSYLEYCVYQALHTGNCPAQYFLELIDNSSDDSCSFDLYSGGKVPDQVSNRVCLRLLLLASTVSTRIELKLTSNFRGRNLGAIDSAASLPSETESIIQSFCMAWIDNEDFINQDTRIRVLRLFSKISLHRTLFRVLGNEEVPSEIYQEGEVAATILYRCIGPLCSMSSDQDSPDSHQFIDLMAECYIRSAACFGRLALESNKSGLSETFEFLERSNYTIALLRNSLLNTTNRRLRPLWEKTAKAMAIAARQRANQLPPKEVIPPLLLSLQFFLKLAQGSSDHSEYNLSARWAHLSTFFESADAVEGACFAQAAALYSRCSELSSEHDGIQKALPSDLPLQIIHMLARESKMLFITYSDPIAYNDKDKAISRRLVELFLKSTSCNPNQSESWNGSHLSPSSVARLLESSIPSSQSASSELQRKSDFHFRLGDVVRSLFGIQEGKDDPLSVGEKLSTLIHLMVCLASTIQRKALENPSATEVFRISTLTTHYVKVTEVVADMMKSLAGLYPETLLASLQSMFYLVASSSLSFPKCYQEISHLDRHQGRVDDTRCLSETFVKRANEILETLPPFGDDFEFKSLFVAMKAATANFSLRLSRSHGPTQLRKVYDAAFTACNQAFIYFSRDSQFKSDVYDFSRQSFVWTLSGLYNWLRSEGDIFGAVVVSRWNMSLSIEQDTGECDWRSSVELFSCLSSELMSSVDSSTVHMLNQKADSANKLSCLAKVEFAACHARQFIRAPIKYPGIETSAVADMLSTLHVMPEQDKPADSALAFWVLSTVDLANSEFQISRGNYVLAMNHIRKCIVHCNKLLELLKNQDMLVADDGRPLWALAALSSMFHEVAQRRVDCIFCSAAIYGQLGSHRKADGYMMSVKDWLASQEQLNIASNSSLFDLLLAGGEATTSRSKFCLRVYQELRARSKSFDNVVDAVSRWRSQQFLNISGGLSFENGFHLAIADSQRLFSIGDILYADGASTSCKEYRYFYEEAERKVGELTNESTSPWLASSSSLPHPLLEGGCLEPMLVELKLRHVRCLIKSSLEINSECHHRVRNLCMEVLESRIATAMNRAWAFYYLGTLELCFARTTGALFNLWQGHSNGMESETESNETIKNAREHFLNAVSHMGSATEVFYRSALRNLALVTGPEHSNEISSFSSCALILSSIGRLTRQHMMSLISETAPTEVLDAFGAFDGCFDNVDERNRRINKFCVRFAHMVPSDWNFVAPVLCSSGEVLMTSISKSHGILKASTICIFGSENLGGAYNEIVKPLDEIIQRSQDHLQGMNQSTESMDLCEESTKRNWWNERKKLDTDLQNLIERVEVTYFGSPDARRLFGEGQDFGWDGDSSSDDDSSSGLTCKNLSLQFESASYQMEPNNDTKPCDSRLDEERQELRSMTVVQLKSILRDFLVPDAEMRRLRKHELIDMVINERHNCKMQNLNCQNNDESTESMETKCTFLILDENLHRFPFENMSYLEGKTVCRIPSLPFVFLTLYNRQQGRTYKPPVVDSSRVTYIIDPENNLHATRSRINPVIESLSLQHGRTWNGLVGSKPSAAYVEERLAIDNGMFLYFGHGGGQTFFSRRQLEGMVAKRSDSTIESKEACRVAAILMGCSSGKLLSINRKDTESTDELPLFFDPEGIAISYLCAGAPCVVGNLWDVTDHDIDRYAVALITSFLGSSGASSEESLASCVSSQRKACKLRFIVGCAPVYYGVPVFLSDRISESQI